MHRLVHTENSVDIRGDIEEVWDLASQVERWPAILPHYRSVRVLAERDGARLVEMRAHRDGIPLRWWAEQRCDPATPRIAFHHVAGITRGMDVEWSFEPTQGGVRVRNVNADAPLAYEELA